MNLKAIQTPSQLAFLNSSGITMVFTFYLKTVIRLDPTSFLILTMQEIPVKTSPQIALQPTTTITGASTMSTKNDIFVENNLMESS